MARMPTSNFRIADDADLKIAVSHDLECRGLPSKWKWKYRITNRISYFQWLLRKSEYFESTRNESIFHEMRFAIMKLRKNLLGERLGLDIPRNVFGPGLSIAHSGSIVVNGDARVGSRCRIHQGVSIVASEKGAPLIGNDVFIGPNAVIVGQISIGDGAYIYPGAVVARDVPAGCGARGVPAKVCDKTDFHSHGAAMKISLSSTRPVVDLAWKESE